MVPWGFPWGFRLKGRSQTIAVEKGGDVYTVIEAQMHMQSAKERVEHLIMQSAKQIIISLAVKIK
jgi:hypothetical protein